MATFTSFVYLSLPTGDDEIRLSLMNCSIYVFVVVQNGDLVSQRGTAHRGQILTEGFSKIV